jgi:hypothetical protein
MTDSAHKQVLGVLYYLVVTKIIDIIAKGIIAPRINNMKSLSTNRKKCISLIVEVCGILLALFVLKRRGLFNNK